MDLRAYLDDLPSDSGVKDFARRCGISEVYVFQLAARQGGRQASPKLCNVIVRETGNKVTLQDLRPDDWASIWPHLKSKRKDKPSVAEPHPLSQLQADLVLKIAKVILREGPGNDRGERS